MTNQEQTLRDAVARELPVQAHVRLLNGEHRVRVGPVASVTGTHVTIFDLFKGYRTTPINLVVDVKIQEPKRSFLGALFARMQGGV